jgi:hypothetical protein
MSQEEVLLGRGPEIVTSPAAAWLDGLQTGTPLLRAKMRLDGPARAVREYVVRELPRHAGLSIGPGRIAAALALSVPQVTAILAELETRLFFLVRDGGGAVSWAFPVTSARTPHHLAFSTGEAAWGA